MAGLCPTTRREFLRQGVGLIGWGATVPTFLAQTVRAMTLEADGSRTTSRPGIPEDRVLVVIHFAGGNDGLNTVVPYTNDDYYRARPTLGIGADRVLKIDGELGFHPEARGLKELWDAGRLSVIHGVGYPNPNRSHFVGTRIWATASPGGERSDGWIGRYFDHCCRGQDPPPPVLGIAIDDEMPLAMLGRTFSPVCAKRPETFGAGQGRNAIEQNGAGKKARRARPPQKNENTLDFLRRSALDAAVNAQEIRSAARKEISGVKFPQGEFARELESVARLIAAGMRTKVYYVSLGGFDTHSQQSERHARVLRDGTAALAAFVDALQQLDCLDRTLIMTFSEFGRRVAENASGGTDHGQAAPQFVIGGGVRPGFHGAMPPLDNLSLGDQTFTTDFRQIYATVLRRWLRTDADKILDGSWPTLPLWSG